MQVLAPICSASTGMNKNLDTQDHLHTIGGVMALGSSHWAASDTSTYEYMLYDSYVKATDLLILGIQALIHASASSVLRCWNLHAPLGPPSLPGTS